MIRAIEVKPLPGYRIWVRFEDGVEGETDLADLAGRGVFAAWDDRATFEAVRVGGSGELTWGDVDLSAESLYLRITGQSPEDILPGLRQLAQHAGD